MKKLQKNWAFQSALSVRKLAEQELNWLNHLDIQNISKINHNLVNIFFFKPS